jgi:hypothetical protein
LATCRSYPWRAKTDLKFLLLKQARHTKLVPQITPPLLSCGRLHLTQSRSGNWSKRLPGSMAGALMGSVVTRE